MIKLSDLLAGIQIKSIEGDKDKLVSGITDNSKDVKKDFLFFAIYGNKFDGHDFIDKAIKKGSNTII